MTTKGKKPPKKKRTARRKRWGPSPEHHEKPAKRAPEPLEPISLHLLDFESVVRGLLGAVIRKPK